MPRPIVMGKTICDFIDLLVLHSRIVNNDIVSIVALNQFEWNEFKFLASTNTFEYVNSIVNLGESTAQYKNIFVMYDGSKDTSNEYKYHFEDLNRTIEEHKARVNNARPEVNLTGYEAQQHRERGNRFIPTLPTAMPARPVINYNDVNTITARGTTGRIHAVNNITFAATYAQPIVHDAPTALPMQETEDAFA